MKYHLILTEYKVSEKPNVASELPVYKVSANLLKINYKVVSVS